MTSVAENLTGFAAYIGLDWADQKHDIWLLAADTAAAEASILEQTPEAIDAWACRLRLKFGGQPVAICLEGQRGALISALMKYDFITLFLLPPKQLAKYREAMTSSGAKDDPTDAALLLDYLLRHGERLRAWKPDDPKTRELALLVETRRKAVDLRTQLTNQLTSALKIYYPQALNLAGELHSQLACDFLAKWPTLTALQKTRLDKVRRFYYAHHCRGDVVEERLAAIPKAVHLTTDEAIVHSAVFQVQLLVGQLRSLIPSISKIEKRIEQLMKEHPDAGFFNTLPGAGKALAPRLLAAFGSNRERFASAEEVQCFSGIAPVTKRSGKSTAVHRRYACPKFLRQTFHEFTACSLKKSAWAKAYYQLQKSRGKKHHATLRSLAFKWIRILFQCWKTRIPYNEQRYLQILRDRNAPLIKYLDSPGSAVGISC